jgi:PAB-dependent poly(A)-specific ribonuclease subunit 3
VPTTAPAKLLGDTFSACPYIHDHAKLNQNENAKKRFNVDSPSFTPLTTTPNGSVTSSARNAAISPKAANAAVFTPKSQRSSEYSIVNVNRVCVLIYSAASTPNLHNKEPAIDWHAPDFQEFVPETFGGPMVCAPISVASSLSDIMSAPHYLTCLLRVTKCP